MNKGFFYYFSRSLSITKFAYNRLSFLKKIELTLFLLVCYIGSAIFFIRPIFSIALMNAGRMIEETHNLSISKCFEGITKNGRFKELLIANLYVFFLVSVITTLFFIPNIPFIVFPVLTNRVWLLVMIITVSLAAIIDLIIEIKYLPLAYVASGTINTSAGDMLLNVRNIKKSAVFTELLLIIVFGIFALLLVGASVGGIVLVSQYLLYQSKTWFWLIFGLFILIPVFLFFPFTFFMSSMHVALYELYKDTVSLKKVYVVKEIAGTEVSYASIFPIEPDEIELIKEEKIGGKK